MAGDKLLNKLPKHILPIVEEVYKDSEGYWIFISEGHIFSSTRCHTEHTLSLKELLKCCKKDNLEKE